ncbi:SGNH/GDSL hydrolase family protein [Candidatus Frankia nodulisporulans]|uniref:SGNH/GDSL hydrolase family protein n=1 Tax=Candidatus Frankia nodulisporulans TaxID=2060052 RepID=UPI001CDD6153|nr:SGNH/GDSL hydrolase family protein [Candidatus Frankia nodulisporulans]
MHGPAEQLPFETMRDREVATCSGRRLGRRTFVERYPNRPVRLILALVIFAITATVSAGWGEPASAAAPTEPRTLAALGDSYSSGEGTPPFDTVDPRCRHSAQAWPRLLTTLDPSISIDVFAACAGATTEALTSPFRGELPQITQLREASPAPDVVTITIGGNDAGFSRVIVSCYTWKCFWTGNDKYERDYVSKELPDLLVASYKAMKVAAPDSRILVVGYPSIIPSSQSKNTCRWLSNSERGQLTRLNSLLNQVIRQSAAKAGVEYVSTDRALRGHELCTKDSWVAPISVFAPARDLSAHPNADGQLAIAKTVSRYLDAHDR